MSSSGSTRECFLVEWYQPGLVGGPLDDAVDRLKRAAESALVRPLLVLDVAADETLFVLFAAGSASAVRRVCRQAGWHVDRVTAGVQVRTAAGGATGEGQGGSALAGG